RYEKNSTDYATAVNGAMDFGKYEEADKIRPRFHGQFSSSALVKGLPFQKEGPRRWAAWEKLAKPAELSGKLKTLRAELRKLLDRKVDLEVKNQTLSQAELRKVDELNFEI